MLLLFYYYVLLLTNTTFFIIALISLFNSIGKTLIINEYFLIFLLIKWPLLTTNLVVNLRLIKLIMNF